MRQVRARARPSLRLALIARPGRGRSGPGSCRGSRRASHGRGRSAGAAAELRDGAREARHERGALGHALVGEQPPEHELQLLVTLRQEQLLPVLVLAAQRLQQRLHSAHTHELIVSAMAI